MYLLRFGMLSKNAQTELAREFVYYALRMKDQTNPFHAQGWVRDCLAHIVDQFYLTKSLYKITCNKDEDAFLKKVEKYFGSCFSVCLISKAASAVFIKVIKSAKDYYPNYIEHQKTSQKFHPLGRLSMVQFSRFASSQ